jgi:HSP20 family protein
MKEFPSAIGSVVNIKVIDGKTTTKHEEQLSKSIAERAFDIFERDGRTLGRDIDHWFQAEAEMLHPAHVEISESDNALTVRAEVPGYRADELEVSVAPQRVTISGKRESRIQRTSDKVVYTEQCADQIFRAFDLPAEVSNSKSTAILADGVLEIAMPKAAQASQTRAAAQSA